jgi:hypothetical protein
VDGSSNDKRAKNDQRFKCVILNIEGLGEKEEELDKLLDENNIQITESKKTLQEIKNKQLYSNL